MGWESYHIFYYHMNNRIKGIPSLVNGVLQLFTVSLLCYFFYIIYLGVLFVGRIPAENPVVLFLRCASNLETGVPFP